MRIFLISLFCAVVPAFALTLEEKIEMARRAADDAVASGSAGGGIVSGDVDILKTPETQLQNKVEQKKSKLAKPETSTSNMPTKPKYVVDTSKDFINGMYIGRVGQSDEERKASMDFVKKTQELPKDGNGLSFSETDLFFIAGKDASAVSSLRRVAVACETAFENLFPKWAYAKSFQAKNTLRVFASDTQMSDVVISNDSGIVFIDVKWSENLSLEEVCNALVRSIFYKLALSQKREYKIPQWLAWAIECAVLDEIKLGISSYLARVAIDFPHKDVLSVLSYTDKEKNLQACKAHSFWLLKALAKISDKNNLFAMTENVVGFALSAEDTFAQFKKIMRLPNDVDTDLWLGCVMSSEICARSGGVDSCKASELEILRMCSVRVFVNLQPVSLPFDNLYSCPKENSISSVNARLFEIKTLLVKTNPIYFNSAVLLGEVYEAFLRNDNALYASKIQEFIVEFGKARATAQEVEKIMNKNLEKMSDK